MSKVIIKRKDLYDQVWTMPMTELGKRYGLSDVGLAKICKKLNVPRPSVGYWSKLRAGKNVARPELPAENDPSKEIYEIDEKYKSMHSQFPQEIITKIEEINEANIKVPQKYHRYHPLVEDAKIYFITARKDSDGLLGNKRQQECLNLRTSSKTLNRALRIMNTIIVECSKRNIVIKNDSTWKTYAIYEGKRIPFKLREKLEKVINEDKNAWSDYKLIPTGKLSIEIERYFGTERVRKNFIDTKNNFLENMVGNFIQSIIQIWYLENESDRIRELERKRKQAEKEILLNKLKVIELEEAKIEELKRNAILFKESELIRRYVLKKQEKIINLSPIERDKIEKWIDWALIIADKIDPTIEGERFSNREKENLLEMLKDYRFI